MTLTLSKSIGLLFCGMSSLGLSDGLKQAVHFGGNNLEGMCPQCAMFIYCIPGDVYLDGLVKRTFPWFLK